MSHGKELADGPVDDTGPLQTPIPTMDNKLIQLNQRLDIEKKHLNLAARAGRIFGDLGPMPECNDNNERVVKYVTAGSLSITIDGIHDTEGYAKAQEAFRILKKINGAITTWEKEVKADANRFRAMVGDYVKDLTADIDTAKAHLTGIMSDVDRQRQEAEEELRRKEEERYAKRCSGLLSMGMYFDPAQRKFFITGDTDGPGLDDSLVRLGDADSLKGVINDVFMPRVKELSKRKTPEAVKEEPLANPVVKEDPSADPKEPQGHIGMAEKKREVVQSTPIDEFQLATMGYTDFPELRESPDGGHSLKENLHKDGQRLNVMSAILQRFSNDRMNSKLIQHGMDRLKPKFEELITAIECLRKETIWNN